MVVPYPRMPKNPNGRWLWIGLSCVLILAFLALSGALIVLALSTSVPSTPSTPSTPGDPAERPVGADLIPLVAMLLACLLGTALFAWILFDGLRTIARERAEQRRLETSIRETRARIEELRNRRH